MAEAAKRRKTHCMYYIGTVPCKCDRCDQKDYDNCRKRDRYVKPSEEVAEALTKSRHMLVEDWFKEPASRCEICSEKSMICHIMDCKTCVEDENSDSFHEGCPDCKNYGMYVSVWRCIIHCAECAWPATGLCWKHDEPYDSFNPTFKKMMKDGMVMTRADWVNGDGKCEECDEETDYFSLKGDRERFVRPRRCGVHCKECGWDIGCVVTKEYCSRHLPPSQTWMGLAADADDDEDDNDSKPLLN